MCPIGGRGQTVTRPPIGMFLDPADAMTAVLAVNAPGDQEGARALWRRDLSPLTPADAPALRRFAIVLERRHSRAGFWGRVTCESLAKILRNAADRLNAGEIEGRL